MESKKKRGCCCGCCSIVILIPLLLLTILVFLFIGRGSKNGSVNKYISTNTGLSEAVLAHQPLVAKYAKQYHIADKEALILAIMQVESGGNAENTKDVMQASESKGLPPNSIATVEESIDAGVSYLAGLFRSALEMGLDDWSVVQSYNYGGGFLYYVNSNGKQYSFELAETFSAEKADYKRLPYTNDVSKKMGKEYIYAYGNMYYVPMVKQYINTVGGLVQSDGKLIFPIRSPYMTSDYMDSRIAITGGALDSHLGVDFVSKTDGNSAEILAAANGEVYDVSWNDGGGNMVGIKHGEQLYTQYAHLSKVTVRVGDQVRQGDPIGIVGATGSFVTGVHLHFQVSTTMQWWDSHQNPWDYLPSLD